MTSIENSVSSGYERLRVFLCHASEDKQAVRDLYNRLVKAGHDPWFDEEKLLPGQDWELEIREAVRESDVVIVCLSEKAVTKRGFVQSEIKLALDVADEQPEGGIFIIPVKLEECELPQRLRKWHPVASWATDGFHKLEASLELRLRSKHGHAGLPKRLPPGAMDNSREPGAIVRVQSPHPVSASPPRDTQLTWSVLLKASKKQIRFELGSSVRHKYVRSRYVTRYVEKHIERFVVADPVSDIHIYLTELQTIAESIGAEEAILPHVQALRKAATSGDTHSSFPAFRRSVSRTVATHGLSTLQEPLNAAKSATDIIGRLNELTRSFRRLSAAARTRGWGTALDSEYSRLSVLLRTIMKHIRPRAHTKSAGDILPRAQPPTSRWPDVTASFEKCVLDLESAALQKATDATDTLADALRTSRLSATALPYATAARSALEAYHAHSDPRRLTESLDQISSAIGDAKDPEHPVTNLRSSHYLDCIAAAVAAIRRNCFLIVDRAGGGKTNLVCHLTEFLSTDDVVRLFIPGRLQFADRSGVETFLQTSLRHTADLHLSKPIHDLAGLAQREGKYIVLFIDAINEDAPTTLVNDAIRDLLVKTEATNIRLCVTCRDVYWELYSDAFLPDRVAHTMVDTIHNFTDEEAQEAIAMYFRDYEVRGELVGEARQKCTHPLFLRFFCETYRGMDVGVVRAIRRTDLFEHYWARKVREIQDRAHLVKPGDIEDLLLRVCSAMRSCKRAQLTRRQIRGMGIREMYGEDSLYARVLDEDIIMEEKDDCSDGVAKVVFVYEEFMEYMLARHIMREDWWHGTSRQLRRRILLLVEESRTMNNIMGALEYLCGMAIERMGVNIMGTLVRCGKRWRSLVWRSLQRMGSEGLREPRVLQTVEELLTLEYLRADLPELGPLVRAVYGASGEPTQGVVREALDGALRHPQLRVRHGEPRWLGPLEAITSCRDLRPDVGPDVRPTCRDPVLRAMVLDVVAGLRGSTSLDGGVA